MKVYTHFCILHHTHTWWWSVWAYGHKCDFARVSLHI